MTTTTIFMFMIAGVFAIDFCAQMARHKKDQRGIKFAGLWPMMLLALSQKKRQYQQKSLVIKQFFLSSIIVIFLSIAIFFLLSLGLPVRPNVMHYGLLLAPLFILPFFHLLYDLAMAHPLMIDVSLINFRFRGALALIMSSNIIFISLFTPQHIFLIASHFTLAFLSLVGTFYLCSRLRKKIFCYDAPLKDHNASFEPMILHYLASLLELFYYLVLVFLVFIEGLILESLPNVAAILFFVPLILLIFVTIVVKISFSFDSPFSLEFYEEKALPMSFLFLGITSIFRYYF